MNQDAESKKVVNQQISEVNHPLLPKVTNDEIDLEIDTQRDNEIEQDKPPHHG